MVKIRISSGGAYRKGAGHNSYCKALIETPILVGKSSVDVDALAPLGKAVFRAVYDAPLYRIACARKAREDNREIAAALGGWTLKQAVDVFKQDIARVLKLHEPVYVPPQNSLFTLYPSGMRQRFRDGIVLAGKPSNEHVGIRNVNLSVFESVEDPIDVLIDATPLTEMLFVAAPCKLLGVRSRGLPLICPYGLKWSGSGKTEVWIIAVVSVEREAKATNAGE